LRLFGRACFALRSPAQCPRCQTARHDGVGKIAG
jgi:hypothetical protein